jgi:CheY-like chemotaxis protein
MDIEKKDAKILIVDDDRNVREILCYLFKKRGFMVRDAGNGIDALKEVAQDKPDIIILDVAMPEMDGLETCKRLRESPDTQDIPIIFLSAQRGITEFIQHQHMPGAAIEYIEKPCDIGYLLKQSNKLIAGQKTT